MESKSSTPDVPAGQMPVPEGPYALFTGRSMAEGFQVVVSHSYSPTEGEDCMRYCVMLIHPITKLAIYTKTLVVPISRFPRDREMLSPFHAGNIRLATNNLIEELQKLIDLGRDAMAEKGAL